MLSKQRIIVAVDVDHPDKAIELVKQLGPFVGSFKIGLELITALLVSILAAEEQEALVNFKKVREFFAILGDQFFWDGKFHDIPNTMGAVSKIVGQSVKPRMFNVHASSGIEGMMAAVANKGDSRVLAVTVLTSHEGNNAHLIFGLPTKAAVLQFARDAKLAGCDGVVCSPEELILLDDQPELAGFWKVTPGIRSPHDLADDQKRTMTPQEAIAAGACELVIGRPITAASGPLQAVATITQEISQGLLGRFHLSMLKLQKVKFGAFKLKLHEEKPDAPLSPIYLDVRKLPEWMYALAGDILHDLADRENVGEFDYVIGIPKAGEPIGQAFAKAVGRPHLRLAKTEGGEGPRRITSTILDPFERGKKVVLIDDLVTRAETKLEAIRAIEENGLEVVATLVLYDREQGGLTELNAQGRKTYAAARLSKMLDLFVNKKKITAEKRAEVMAYIAAN